MDRQSTFNDLNARAVSGAVAVARKFGLDPQEPVVLHGNFNTLIHLQPEPVVARVATVTSLVRPDTEHRVQGQLDLAAFLAERETRAVAPTQAIPPGPHESEGLWISFWQHVPSVADTRPPQPDVARALFDLHDVLREYSGDLPTLDVMFDDVDRVLVEIERSGAVSQEDLALMRSETKRARHLIAVAGEPTQAVHSDAHGGNLLVTPDGLVWTDFEEASVGPIEWDLACLASLDADPEAALSQYPESPPFRNVEPWIDARRAQVVPWLLFRGLYMPAFRERAERALGAWRATIGGKTE